MTSAIAAVTACLVLASTASAAWTSPFELFAPRIGHAFEPQVAVDATGNAVMAWITDGHVVARTRSAATGALGPVLAFGGPGAHFARVAVSADGHATVVWLRSDGAVNRVLARSLSPTGMPGPTVRVSAARARVRHRVPQVGVATSGRVVIAWQTSRGLQARSLSPNGRLGATIRVLNVGLPPTWRMAVAGGGRAVFVWGSRLPAHMSRLSTRSLSATGVPGPITAISTPGEDWQTPVPQVAATGDGRAVVTWTRAGDGSNLLRARRLSVAGKPGPILAVSAVQPGGLQPQVAIDADANAIVTWTQISDDDSERIRARTLLANGKLGPIIDVFSSRAYAFGPQIGVTPDGRAVLAWGSAAGDAHGTPYDNRIQTRALSADGELGPVATLTDAFDADSGSAPQLAVAANAEAIAIWEIGYGLGRTWRVRAAASY